MFPQLESHRNWNSRTHAVLQEKNVSCIYIYIYIWEWFGLQNSKSNATSIEKKPDFCIESNSCPSDVASREKTGCIMYLRTGACPDLTYSGRKMFRIFESPKQVHWTAVKRLLWYNNGARTYASTYRKEENGSSQSYYDGDWVGNLTTHISPRGYVFTMSGRNKSWCSSKRTIVANSSWEAEYVLLIKTGKEAVRLLRIAVIFLKLRNSLNLIGFRSNRQYTNSPSVNVMISCRNKHIDTTYHFVI